MKIGRFANITLILLLILAVVLVESLSSLGRLYFLSLHFIAEDSGFLALALIAATGLLMLFKAPLASALGSQVRLWQLHVAIAGVAGAFLALHVAIFFDSGLSLPILFGYVASGAALFVWLTGAVYIQGRRGSSFLHGLFTIGAVFLSIFHTVALGRNIPMELSGLALGAIGVAMLIGVMWRLTSLMEREERQGHSR